MRVSTGTDALDQLLAGGIESDIISVIYGPGGSGKTNICLHCAISVIRSGKKAIYIDTEGGFSVERLRQLEGYSDSVSKKIFFLRPTSFGGQKKAFEKLEGLVDDKIGLIILDSIAMLYRLEIGKGDHIFDLNRELGRQITFLSQIARKKKIPVLMTNQVYSSFDEPNSSAMVGGDLLKYQSKCLIELQNLRSSRRLAILKKHRSLPESKKVIFEIREKGIVKVEPKK